MRSACFCSIVVGLEHQSLQQGKTQRLSFELEEIRSHALLSNKQSLEKMASIFMLVWALRESKVLNQLMICCDTYIGLCISYAYFLEHKWFEYTSVY